MNTMRWELEKKIYDSIEIGDLYEYIPMYKSSWPLLLEDTEIVLIVDKIENSELDIVYLSDKRLYRTPLNSFVTYYIKVI